MDSKVPYVSKHLLSKDRAGRRLDIRELMAIDESNRDLWWLSQMLQWAVQVELATIPPYLLAKWSIQNQADQVATLIDGIMKQEMGHMGTACNLLNAIGGHPDLTSPGAVPTYPTQGLPGGVHPHLYVDLRAISLDVVADTFMIIEEPETSDQRWHHGQTYPTIGAFYTAIQRRILKLKANEIAATRQIPKQGDIDVISVGTAQQAADAIDLIKAQGEGTPGSPEVSPGSGEFAHYWIFGEIYQGARLQRVSPTEWNYSGPPVPFPTEIYPVAPIPKQGYPQSHDFNVEFSSMLKNLQTTWELGWPQGTNCFKAAKTSMEKLYTLALPLIKTQISPGKNMGPAFQFV